MYIYLFICVNVYWGNLPVGAVGCCHYPSGGDDAATTDVASVVFQGDLVRVVGNVGVFSTNDSSIG